MASGCAIVVNSGCANACTGDEGWPTPTRMAEEVALALGCPSEQVLVASTGVIGVGLNMDRVVPGIREACASLRTRQRQRCSTRHHDDRPVSEGTRRARDDATRGRFPSAAMAKGLRNDRAEYGDDARLHFDRCPGDGPRCCSARSSNQRATRSTRSRWTASAPPTTRCSRWRPAAAACSSTRSSIRRCSTGCSSVSRPLALGIVRGGEGATKLIAVTVYDARTADEARQVARTIANSPLVKTAVHGADPNWGRIVAAAGRAGVRFDIQRVTVRIGGVLLFENGLPHDESAPRAAEMLKRDTVDVEVGLGAATPPRRSGDAT